MSPPNLPTQRELFEWKRQLVKQSRPYFNSLSENQKEALRVYKYAGYHVINKFLRNLAQQTKSGGQPINSPFGKFMLDIRHSTMTHKLLEEYQKAREKITDKTTLGQLTEIIQKFHYDAYQDVIKDMDDCFAPKSRVPKLTNPHLNKKTILYRGTSLPAKMLAKRPGDILEFGEYLSTTLEPEIAFRFLGLGADQDTPIQPVLLIIRGYDGRPFIFLDWQAVETKKMNKLKYAPGADEYELVLPRGCQFKIINKYRSKEYAKFYNPEQIALENLSDLYSDIGDVESNFMSRASVKEIINKPIDITVLELEYVKRVAKDVPHISPTDPGVLTEMDLFLGQLVPPTKKKKTIKSECLVKTGKGQTLKTNTKHVNITAKVGDK